ncbi:MAG: HAD-IIB family hydrolase [Bifidobacteriaceae bacterium]|jgi:HAD superfamily hydrolase (TIGR01484 family)|nr:HAD-IIB family hydrolase [Bifidobacteriaceae bacterium]
MYKLYAFDLDGTLAASKSKISAFMAQLLNQLLKYAEVCIISGGKFEQFDTQVLSFLDPKANLKALHIMPTCGTQYYKWAGKNNSLNFTQIYAKNLSLDEVNRSIEALEEQAKKLHLWETHTWGDKIENRGSQITFSALGQLAPVEVKEQWDPNNLKKDKLREAVARQLPDLEVRSGGSTSVDITRKGIDKAYGMRKLKQITHIDFSEMVFYGDRLDKNGNDYPVKKLGINTVAVVNPDDTITKIHQEIENLTILN